MHETAGQHYCENGDFVLLRFAGSGMQCPSTGCIQGCCARGLVDLCWCWSLASSTISRTTTLAFIHVLALAHRVALLRGGGYCGVFHFCGEHFFGDADAPGLVKDATLNIAFVMTMMCLAVGMGYIFLSSGIDMVHRSRRLFDTFLLQVVWHRL